jgi:hypothetical protein
VCQNDALMVSPRGSRQARVLASNGLEVMCSRNVAVACLVETVREYQESAGVGFEFRALMMHKSEGLRSC